MEDRIIVHYNELEVIKNDVTRQVATIKKIYECYFHGGLVK